MVMTDTWRTSAADHGSSSVLETVERRASALVGYAVLAATVGTIVWMTCA